MSSILITKRLLWSFGSDVFIFHVLWILHCCLCIWSSDSLLWSLLSAFSSASKIIYHIYTCYNGVLELFSAGNLDFHKGSLIHGLLSKTVWSWFMGHYRVQNQDRICMPIIWCMGGEGSSWVPWHVSCIYLTAFTRSLLSMYGYQIVFEWNTNQGHFQPWCLILKKY